MFSRTRGTCTFIAYTAHTCLQYSSGEPRPSGELNPETGEKEERLLDLLDTLRLPYATSSPLSTTTSPFVKGSISMPIYAKELRLRSRHVPR